jgi:phage internal scaffolding protein
MMPIRRTQRMADEPIRRRVVHPTGGPVKTEQHHQDAVNVNTIMRKAFQTGMLPQKSNAFYGDFSNVVDFQTAQNAIKAAEQAFYTVPAEIRKRFENSPQKLLEFLEDADNREEAMDLGLIERPPVEDVEEPSGVPSEPPPESPE